MSGNGNSSPQGESGDGLHGRFMQRIFTPEVNDYLQQILSRAGQHGGQDSQGHSDPIPPPANPNQPMNTVLRDRLLRVLTRPNTVGPRQ